MAAHDSIVLDVSTLIFVVGLISLLQSFALYVVSSYNRQAHGMGVWATAALANGLAMPLIALRIHLDSAVITKVLPTSLNFISAYLFYVGARRFQQCGTLQHWPLLASLPCYGGYVWLVVHDESLRLRPFLTSPIFILFLTMGARALLTERRPALRFAASFTAYSALAVCGVFIWRAIDLYYLTAPAQLLEPVRAQVLGFITWILWSLLWTFGAMMMVNQRQTFENEQLHQGQLWAAAQLAAAENELLALRTEQQRQQLASELHDGIGGITANLAMLAFRGSMEEKPQQQKALFQHIEFLATEWNRELRLWMNGMERGSLLWGDALAEAHAYAQRLATAQGIELDWKQSGATPREPDDHVQQMISVMRALKEAVNNLVRHSTASRASVHIAFRPQRLGIVIKDDGCGFDAAQARPGSRGLKNMQRRVEDLGGAFKRRRLAGTTLCLTIPLPLLHVSPKKLNDC